MNIVLTLDNNYCQHAAVVIASVYLNNPGSHDFYIIIDYISTSNKQKLLRQISQTTCKIHFIVINKNQIINFPIGKNTANTYISLAAYYRLFLIDLLPSNIERILYLDCDTIVNKSLQSLWEWNFSPNACIAALEEQEKLVKERTKILQYPILHSYFNSGVILINLIKMRKYYSTAKAIEYIKEHKKSIKYHDQDVLNYFFHNKIDFIPLEFNVMDIFLYKGVQLQQRYIKEEKSLFAPKIIHFSGPMKPWFKECKHPYKTLYYYYLSKTEWKSYIPHSKFIRYQDKLMYHIKEIIKYILNMLNIGHYSYRKDFYKGY